MLGKTRRILKMTFFLRVLRTIVVMLLMTLKIGDCGLEPKLLVDYLHGPLSTTVKRFVGNDSFSGSFKIVKREGEVLFVGGM